MQGETLERKICQALLAAGNGDSDASVSLATLGQNFSRMFGLRMNEAVPADRFARPGGGAARKFLSENALFALAGDGVDTEVRLSPRGRELAVACKPEAGEPRPEAAARAGAAYKALFAAYRDQPRGRIFASFGYDPEAGEDWQTPFARIAGAVRPEKWAFRAGAHHERYRILRNYLNRTFLRVQEERKIVYSADGRAACFNSGLQDSGGRAVHCVFVRDPDPDGSRAAWSFWATAPEGSLLGFPSEPEAASFVGNRADLVFDQNYECVSGIGRAAGDDEGRPPSPPADPALAAAVAESLPQLRRRLRRDGRIAVPQWHNGRIQMLLPLCLLDPLRADAALVAVKDRKRMEYRIMMSLPLELAYGNARLLGRPESDWLRPD